MGKNNYHRLHPTMGKMYGTEDGQLCCEVETAIRPSKQFVSIMAAVAEGVGDIESVVRPVDRTIMVFSEGVNEDSARTAFGQWSPTVMRALSELPPADREASEHRAFGTPIVVPSEALAAHSVVHRT